MSDEAITRIIEGVDAAMIENMLYDARNLYRPMWRINKQVWSRIKDFKTGGDYYFQSGGEQLTYRDIPFELTDSPVFEIRDAQPPYPAKESFLVPASFSQSHDDMQQLITLIYAMLDNGCDMATIRLRLMGLD